MEKIENHRKSERLLYETFCDGMRQGREKALEWIGIGSAPTDGSPILAVDSRVKDGFYGTVVYFDQDNLLWRSTFGGTFEIDSFTHWLRIPLAPKQEGTL